MDFCIWEQRDRDDETPACELARIQTTVAVAVRQLHVRMISVRREEARVRQPARLPIHDDIGVKL